MRLLLVMSMLVMVGMAHAQDTPRMAPVQVEWLYQTDGTLWFDCWPSDGVTPGDVWVYMVYAEGTAPYVCQPTSNIWIQPPPLPQYDRITQIKAVQ